MRSEEPKAKLLASNKQPKAAPSTLHLQTSNVKRQTSKPTTNDQRPTTIKEGALFIADAHYPHHGDEFLTLLRSLESGEIRTPQLFLMGDIFDLLFGCGDYIRGFSSEAIDLLNGLSTHIEIYYFEGNHDFLLKNIFPNINIVPRTAQPLMMRLGNQKVGLSHGDRYEAGFGYEFFTLLLRSPLICLAKPWQQQIIDAQMERLSHKRICRKLEDFEIKAKRITKRYPSDTEMIIEGHFHQARKIGKYISLPSLACQREIGIVRNGEIVFEKVEIKKK